MAGTTITERHQREADRLASYERALAVQRERELAAPDNTSVEFLASQIMEAFGLNAVRTMSSFRSIKTKDVGARRLAIASHIFGKFGVARHVSEIWSTPITAHREVGYVRFQRNERAEDERLKNGFKNPEEVARIRWYIAAASGGSLHKLYTNVIFTKKETHAFLTCPLRFTFREAMIYAYGTTHTKDVGVLTRLAKSKLAENGTLTNALRQDINPNHERAVQQSRDNLTYWKDVVRFFCVNPVPINRLNDLYDFLVFRRGEDREFNLKGRSLDSLTGQMQQWHRDQGRVKRLGNRTWNGIDIDDTVYEKTARIDWRRDVKWAFRQLKSSKDLADEGNKMHHCVYSYQAVCIQGKCAIWSVTKNDERAITLEMRGNSIVQIRGYANRLARLDELHAIKHWASENGIVMPHRGY